MNAQKHAQIFEAYFARMPLKTLKTISLAYDQVWQEQNSGNASSQDKAHRSFMQAIENAINQMLESDVRNIEEILHRNVGPAPHRVVPHPNMMFWYVVEFWNGDKYVPGPAFRSVEEAEQFTGNTHRRPQVNTPQS